MAGATNADEMEASPCVTVDAAGVPGTVAGTVASEATDALLSPTLFVAMTVQVYVLPFVRLLTVIGEPTPVLFPDVPPLLDVHDAVNERIVLPLSAPGVNATEIDALPRVTLVMVGASGTAAGTTGADGRDALLVPTALVAVTVQV